MEIRSAAPQDADRLTRIAIVAKGHWGYLESWIARWREQLTISAEYISAHPTFVAVEEERIVGFAAIRMESDGALLDHLWVLPAAMGRGIGRAIFSHAEEQARQTGAK